MERNISIRVGRTIEKLRVGGKKNDPYFIKKVNKLKKIYNEG